ncbi:MAG: aspartate aminotransferase family protein [Candidatus Poribacteria bacterium]|nr:aspartate aminotransferase family protein [Candidatus Poribacteria bacterium]
MANYTILERYQKVFEKDRELAERANYIFPDGVTHDSRYTDPFPVYIDRAQGARKWGLDGVEFIDYWSGHGALLLGHSHPEIVEAVTHQMSRGTHYGASHPLELEWASLVMELVPSAERVRFVGSGTEATLMAIRLARTYTGKNKVLKFAGHFHGWHDSVILSVNPPYDAPVPGIPKGLIDATVVCPPNDIDAVERCLQSDPDIACLIVEPTGASFGVIPTNGEFLRQLRGLTQDYSVILIFDEVISGFRVSPGGAQGYYQITPDLTTLAKILAGGLPGGAVVGKKEILNLISIREEKASQRGKKMPHPGTFNANPLSASAGIAMLKIVKTGIPHEQVNRTAAMLRNGLNEVIDQHGLDWAVYGEFSGVKFLIGHGDAELRAADFDPYTWDYRTLKGGSNAELTKNLRCGMLLNGIDIAGNGGMTMAAHTEEDVQQTIAAFDQTIEWMKADELI